MISTEEILEEIEEAVRTFGEEAYDQKGAEKTMNLPRIVASLKDMDEKEIITTLTGVIDHPHTGSFLHDITISLKQLKGEKWERVADNLTEFRSSL